MLYLIGIGLNPRQLTFEALDAIKRCESLYLETYTSRFSQGIASELEAMIKKPIMALGRTQVEEGFASVLSAAHKKDIGLLIYGNPLFATTHVQLLLDAQEKGIPSRVIAGISISNYLGHTGLDSYRFGRVTTVVFQEPSYSPESFFDIVTANHERGLHTLCLLDIRTEEERFMGIHEAARILLDIGKRHKNAWIATAPMIGIYAAGSDAQEIRCASAQQLADHRSDRFPQTLIVCGKLTEKEEEALSSLYPTEHKTSKTSAPARKKRT